MGVAGQTLTLNDSGPYSSPYVPVARARIFNSSTGLRPTGWSFARSTIGTYQNASGVVATAAANAERLDYVGGSLLGLLIEVASTAVAAGPDGVGENSAQSNAAVTNPTGGTTSTKYTEDTSSWSSPSIDAHEVSVGLPSTPGAPITYSCFVKAGTRNKCTIFVCNGDGSNFAEAFFDLSTGTFTKTRLSDGAGITDVGIVPFANGWYRIWLSGFTNGNSYATNVMCDSTGNRWYTGDGTSYFYNMMNLIEPYAVCGSYYDPSTLTTRAADVASFTLASDAKAVIITFDDGSTQTFAGLTGGSTFTIPNASLRRSRVKFIDDSTGATAAVAAARRRPLMLLAS